MKKAVIATGGKQYLVSEGETLDVELIRTGKDDSAKTATSKKISFPALLIIDGDKVIVGAPEVEQVKVSADIIAEDVQADKVTSIRYKAKKRVKIVRGHRQQHTTLKVTSIS